MKAVVFKGTRNVAVEEIPDPKITDQREAIVRMTSTGLCGSDLHMYDGRTPMKPGRVLGHEPMGVIENIGSAVRSFQEGDRVVLPFNVSCGYCLNCSRGLTNACLTLNPKFTGAAYGYSMMGPHDGAQAEYLKVPYADFNCIKLPGKEGDHWEEDFMLLSDVFPTAHHAATLAQVATGDTVAVFGAGPVGLLSAYSSLMKGAAMVFVVDYIKERLDKAKEIGAIPIDFAKGDPVEQIMDLILNNPGIRGMWLPGEEKMSGVNCGIDAVGYQAKDRLDPSKENPTQVIDDLVRLTNPGGHIGVIGVYTHEDPGAPTEPAKKGIIPLPFGMLWQKGLSVGTGQTPVKIHSLALRNEIIAGRAKPSFIVSHRMPLESAPEAYQMFDQRADGFTKVIFKPD